MTIKIENIKAVMREVVTDYFKSIDEDDYDIDNYIDSRRSGYNLDEISSKGSMIELVDRYGGEGQGDELWMVFKITHPTHGVFYVEYSGYYSSWEGGTFDDIYQVEPKEVTITQYFKIQ